MTIRFSFVVDDRESGERLDKVVVARARVFDASISRAEVQRAIASGEVTLDGQPAPTARAVRAGSMVIVSISPAISTAEADASVEVRVVYEDASLLVVDKPAGMVVHPSRGHDGKTLVNGLLARMVYDDAEREVRDREGHPRPGIVHRLDKGTSGLLVVAKTALVRERLKELFQAHDIERCYVALVAGSTADATYDTPHGRHPTDRLRFTSFPRGKHRRAVTHVRLLERFPEASMVELTLETGRTHQLRVHLAERARTPILGDPLYGTLPHGAALRAVAAALGHQALHARVLGFRHPTTGLAMRWESPLPDDFLRALEALRATRPSI